MYICIHIYTYVNVYVIRNPLVSLNKISPISLFLYIYTCIYIYIYTYIYVQIIRNSLVPLNKIPPISLSLSLYACIYIFIYIHIYIISHSWSSFPVIDLAHLNSPSVGHGKRVTWWRRPIGCLIFIACCCVLQYPYVSL